MLRIQLIVNIKAKINTAYNVESIPPCKAHLRTEVGSLAALIRIHVQVHVHINVGIEAIAYNPAWGRATLVKRVLASCISLLNRSLVSPGRQRLAGWFEGECGLGSRLEESKQGLLSRINSFGGRKRFFCFHMFV